MITYREYCKTIKEDWGKTSPIPKEVYADVNWRDNFKWIDLGLPSGTLWADVNIPNPDDKNGFWTWYDIMTSPYKNYVPTQEQMEELRDSCEWGWSSADKGMVVKGENGNRIFLPAEGWFRKKHQKIGEGQQGEYWTATEGVDSRYAYSQNFYDSGRIIWVQEFRDEGMSVRLVKNKK